MIRALLYFGGRVSGTSSRNKVKSGVTLGDPTLIFSCQKKPGHDLLECGRMYTLGEVTELVELRKGHALEPTMPNYA